MSNDANPTIINILDREYRISCPPDEQEALTASARYLDQQMRLIRNTGKVVGVERIAVMAALNITHEMLQKPAGKSGKKSSADPERVTSLIDKIDRVLNDHSELDL